MATGMVLVIVMRHIDLVGWLDALDRRRRMGVLQVFNLGPWPRARAIPSSGSSPWPPPSLSAPPLGMFNGLLIAYGRIPAFIVTLGG